MNRHLGTLLALAAALPGGPAAAWTLSVCRTPDVAPYTTPAHDGIDDRVAVILADAMGATLAEVPLPDRRIRTLRRYLHAGGCDVALGVMDNQDGFLTSHAYYATGFAFVTRGGGAPLPASLDDPGLARLRIGVAGDAQHPIPPVIALARRGHAEGLRYFPGARVDDPETAAMAAALKAGEIDLAILWGPAAALLVKDDPDLRVALVAPEIDLPVLPMVAQFTIGMRPQDSALRAAIDGALAARWDEVQAVLAASHLPSRPVARPQRVAAP